MNYGELQDIIAGYLHRTDQTDNIPSFISLAQARINRDVKDPSMVFRAIDTLDGTSRFVTVPSDLRKIIDVQVEISGGRKSLMPLSGTQMNTLYSAIESGADPANYCLRGREMEIQPSPVDGTVLEIVYLARLELFSSSDDTNDLITNHPNLYVYASMLEASPFLQADERTPMWKEYYVNEVERINEEAEDYELSGGPIQIMKLGISTP